LEPEPFDVPIHLGPGMPPTANWIGADAAGESEQSEPTDAEAVQVRAETEAAG
jgi:hypothetical protein